MHFDHTTTFMGFDTETTDVDVTTARIVSAAAVAAPAPGTGDPRVLTWLLRQDAPIPPEAVAVHGITDEIAATGMDHDEAVVQIATALTAGWARGYVLVGHNVSFDLTILDYELARAGADPLVVTGSVIDTLALERHLTPRSKMALAFVAERYDIATPNSHDALADTMTAIAVARAQAPMVGFDSIEQLHDFQRDSFREMQDYFAWRAAKTDKAKAQVLRCHMGWPIQHR